MSAASVKNFGKISFANLHPASAKSSRVGQANSKRANTRCELVLRRELWRRGIRYRLHQSNLPGHPDIVFLKQRVVVFCDGDFWHGRDLEKRLARLAQGHNPIYWMQKVRRNVERDQQQTKALKSLGWVMLRFWETEILAQAAAIADRIVTVLVEQTEPNTLANTYRPGSKIPRVSKCRHPRKARSQTQRQHGALRDEF